MFLFDQLVLVDLHLHEVLQALVDQVSLGFLVSQHHLEVLMDLAILYHLVNPFVQQDLWDQPDPMVQEIQCHLEVLQVPGYLEFQQVQLGQCLQ